MQLVEREGLGERLSPKACCTVGAQDVVPGPRGAEAPPVATPPEGTLGDSECGPSKARLASAPEVTGYV